MNAPTALYSALCLNKNLSTDKIISLMIQILNKKSTGLTSVEILKFIDDLSQTNYNNMSLEEVKTYFKTIIKNDNNNNEQFSFITNDNNNIQYIGSFKIIKATELTDKLTISCTKDSNKYTIFIYTNENNSSIVGYQMNLLVN